MEEMIDELINHKSSQVPPSEKKPLLNFKWYYLR